jgi:hypothetical protein
MRSVPETIGQPFSMRSVPATIGKTVYSLCNNGKQRCYAATIKVFSLWSDPRLYNKDSDVMELVISYKVINCDVMDLVVNY